MLVDNAKSAAHLQFAVDEAVMPMSSDIAPTFSRRKTRMTFREALAEQTWDDHRFYHHNRINQSLHLVSALCFICAYGLLFVEPAASVLIAWLLAMPSRQAGHFFFEPRDYDHANHVT